VHGKVVFYRFLYLLAFILFLCGLSYFRSEKDKNQISQSNQEKPYDSYGEFGIPIPTKDLKILYNSGYIQGYSEDYRIPLWSAYRLKEPTSLKPYKRRSAWLLDQRVKNCPDPGDYLPEITKKDRGHLAPSFAMFEAYDYQAMKESFYTTNATPMSSRLNKGIWSSLENQIFGSENSWTSLNGEVCVICGPILGKNPEKIGINITLPKEYFKIILREEIGENNSISYPLLAFRFPEEGAPDGKAIWDYVCSVDSIEKDTGFDFFPKLEERIETEIEAKINTEMWK
jgi:endonuclease G